MTLKKIAIGVILLCAAGGAHSAEQGFCEMKITGDRTLSFREAKQVLPHNAPAGQKQEAARRASAITDRWLSESHIRSTLTVMSRVTRKSVEEGMRKDPRLNALLVNCGGDGVSLSLGASAASKYANVPFGPKNYVIAPPKAASGVAGFGDHGKPGEFIVIAFNIKTGSENRAYVTAAPGALNITRFDGKGVEGTFSFKAVQWPAKQGESIAVSGSFSLPCEGDNCR